MEPNDYRPIMALDTRIPLGTENKRNQEYPAMLVTLFGFPFRLTPVELAQITENCQIPSVASR